MKKVTIRDIARFTGYALMTVSSAITGRGRISEETREEILAAAKHLRYVPDAAARALRERPRLKAREYPKRHRFIALVVEGSPPLGHWLAAIQLLDFTAVVFLKDKSFSAKTLAACRPVLVVWFAGTPPKSRAFPAVPGDLSMRNPIAALKQWLGGE